MDESIDYYHTLGRMIKAVALTRNLSEETFDEYRAKAGQKVISMLPVGRVLVVNELGECEMNWLTWKMHEILWCKLFGIAEGFPVMEPVTCRPFDSCRPFGNCSRFGGINEAPTANASASWGPVMQFYDETTNQHLVFPEYIELCESRAAAAAIEQYKAEKDEKEDATSAEVVATTDA